jgi:hypothetical protein
VENLKLLHEQGYYKGSCPSNLLDFRLPVSEGCRGREPLRSNSRCSILPAQSRGDEVSYTHAPSEGTEMKLVMKERAAPAFGNSANGRVIDHATHNDGGSHAISQHPGGVSVDQAGQPTATFISSHNQFLAHACACAAVTQSYVHRDTRRSLAQTTMAQTL